MAQTEQKYFDMDVEPILNTPQMRDIQWEKLKRSLEKEIRAKMHSDVKIGPAITWLAPNTLERATKKTQRLEKAYEAK